MLRQLAALDALPKLKVRVSDAAQCRKKDAHRNSQTSKLKPEPEKLPPCERLSLFCGLEIRMPVRAKKESDVAREQASGLRERV